MTVKYRIPESGLTRSQLRLLRPYLVGEQAREDGEWDMYCPLHEDSNRSAQVNADRAVWYCHAGCGGGSVSSLIQRKDEWVKPTAAARNGSGGGRTKRPSGQPAEEITAAKVAGWVSALQSNEVALQDMLLGRGIYAHTLSRFEIGWDPVREAYTIPIKDSKGEYVNVRRYQPRPTKGRRKMWGIEGMNRPRIFPLEILAEDPEEIIICEGELDALITNQFGFPAVTRTASAITWKPNWNRLFKDKIVYVCHDMDEAGQEANRKVALGLAGVAREVRLVRLPYPVAPKHGKDLTDYWLERDGDADEFKRLLEEAHEFDVEPGEEESELLNPSDASVLDSFDARRVGRPLRLTVTIKGKRDPGYSIPRKAQFRCTKDAGEKCTQCPLFETGEPGKGEDERVIAGANPVVLELIDSTRAQVQSALRREARIPECARLRIEVTEYQSVEILFARPSVDHTSGASGDYKNIKLTSVGRHDTQPNSTVQIVGALHPDPRKQFNEFLAWDVARMETSLDRFELDSDKIKVLSRFQPRPGQRPLKRMRQIADDLSHHVTRIYGRPEMHALIDLVLHSVISFDFAGKRVHRGWLDGLIVGDTRTGKSEAATRLTRHYNAGEVVSCETASLAGIVGGLQQYGSSKEWAITWGAIPLNDRRAVVLDEAGGLSFEDIAQMSSVRSSGVAELTKIQQERTYARTRTLWLANPRDARMSDYTYGVQAVRPLIGTNEDIARFDLVMSVSAGEVPSREINRVHDDAPAQRFTAEACSLLLRWVWSRTPEQIVWAPGAERAVLRAADALGGRYVEDPPLIQAANVREKLARIAVAMAARTFSTDDRHERIVVTRDHVKDAVAFIDRIYGMRGFGYAERSKEIIADRREAEEKANDIKVYLYNKPWLAKFLRAAGKFRRQDLEEIGPGVDREMANAIINTLWDARMVVKDKGDVRLTPTLHNILREVNIK